MKLPSALQRFSRQAERTALVERIASRSQNAVWARVRHRAPQMTPFEALGYVHARALQVIHRELKLAIAERQLTRRDYDALAESVRQTVVRRAVTDVIRLQQTTLSQRKAA